jgi:hypothetical protein
MVIDGCQQSFELQVLSGRPEDGYILFSSEPTAMIQCHTITAGHCFLHALVTSVSNAFRKPQKVSNAHRLNYSGRERTDCQTIPACTVESEPTVALKSDRRRE